MFKISCFADEISPEFDRQIDFMVKNNIKYLVVRGVEGTNVMDLSDEELKAVHIKLEKARLEVSCVGSPVGKSDVLEDDNVFMGRVKRLKTICSILKCNTVRIFSFYNPQNIENYEELVVKKTKLMTNYCEENNIFLLHENEANIFGESSVNSLKLLEIINSPNYKAILDPSNFVVAHEKPFDESYQLLKNHIRELHIKDSKGTEIVYVGEGDGQFREIFDTMRDETIFLTLEPHLTVADVSTGFTGEDLFLEDLNKLKYILNSLNIKYI